MDKSAPSTRKTGPTKVWRLVLTYALLAGLWVALTEVLMVSWQPVPLSHWAADLGKGAVFVAVTAGLLSVLVRRALARERAAFDAEREALAAQAQALQLLKQVSDHSPDAVFAKDREGRYLLFNRRAGEVTGVAPEAALGNDARTLFPAQHEQIRRNDQKVMAQNRAEDFEETLDSAQGRITTRATRGPLRDAQGRVIGSFCISRDISDQVAALEQLQASESHYRAMFQANPHPMWVFDCDTLAILAVNDAALTRYGYSRDEFLALNLAELRPPSEHPRMTAFLAKMNEGMPQGLLHSGGWIHRDKLGHRFEVETASNDLFFDGRWTRVVMAVDVSEHRELVQQMDKAIADASAAQALLRNVLDRVADGFVAFDKDWHYTYLNTRAAQMLGRDAPEDLIGRHIWTEFPEGVDQPFHQVYLKAMQTQEVIVFEDHYAPWDRWFENRLYPSPEGLSIYFSDITQRRQDQLALRAKDEALQRSELRHRLASAHGPVWELDIANGGIGFSAGWWESLGRPRPPDVDMAAGFYASMHPDDRAVQRKAMTDHLKHHKPYALELRFQHADGHWIWVQTTGQAVWDDSGRAIYMAGLTVDITPRRRAEQALRESETYRHGLFDRLSDGVLVCRHDWQIVDANERLLTMFGYTREELLQLRLPALMADYELDRLQASLPAMQRGEPMLAEWEHVRRDGQYFTAEINAGPLDDDRFIAVLRDVRTRRESERALLNYQLELSDLTQRLLTQERQTTQRVAQALHDQLGQTLAVARLQLDAAMSTKPDAMPPALRVHCGKLSGQLDQAVREVRQVLADLRPPLLEEQGLAAALDNEIAMRGDDGEADVVLELGDAADSRRWPSDVEYGTFMIAREAITNARLHAEATLIRVLLDGDAGQLRLEVIDDGRGLDDSHRRSEPGHLGMIGMRERAIAIGARFDVGHADGGGTRMALRWEGGQR